MNIDDLTLGQIKEIQNMAATQQPPSLSKGIFGEFIGKYVICRTCNEGVNAGKVLAADETGVVLEDARRLWYFKPKSKDVSWYEGVARDGLSEDSKVGVASNKLIVEDYSLTICTAEAENIIRSIKAYEQD